MDGGFAAGMAGPAKSANGEIEIVELGFGQYEQEGFEEDAGFLEASVEVEVAGIQGVPEIAGIPVLGHGTVGNGRTVIGLHGVDDVFESQHLVQKLGLFGEEDLTDQIAGASGALGAVGPEVVRYQRVEVGENAEMTRTLAHTVENRGQAQGKTRTEFRGDGDRIAKNEKGARIAQADSLIQGNAEGEIGITQFGGVSVEENGFGFRQEGAPILLNRIIPAGRDAGTHGLPPEGGSIYPNHCTREALCCGPSARASILAVYF